MLKYVEDEVPFQKLLTYSAQLEQKSCKAAFSLHFNRPLWFYR